MYKFEFKRGALAALSPDVSPVPVWTPATMIGGAIKLRIDLDVVAP